MIIMKKIIRYMMAGVVALMAAACVEEPSFVQVDTDSFLSPVLNDFTPETPKLTEADAAKAYATVKFTPADYGVASSVNYTLYASISGTNFENEKQVGMPVTSPADEMTVSVLDLNKVLVSLNCTPGVAVELDFRVKSEWMGEKLPVGGSALYSNAVKASATPYSMEKTYDPVWVIGDYCGWSHDKTLFLWNFKEDGNIYTGLIDFGKDDGSGNIVSAAANGWKITGKAGWYDDCNWGEAVKATEADEPASIQLITGGGSQDIMRYAKRFYGFSFDKSSLTVSKICSFDQMGIIGLNGDWNNDIVMEYSKHKQRFYADVEVPADTEFKFRVDADWAFNLGGDLENLSSGGANIAIAAGNYRIYLDMNNADAYVATISADAYGTEEGAGESQEPEGPDTPVVNEGWGIVGTINGWGGDGADIDMKVGTGWYVAAGVELAEGENIKFRLDGAWDVNFGGTWTVGEKIDLFPGGDNMVTTAGTFDIYLNPDIAAAYVLVAGSDAPAAPETWGIVGTINGWGGNDLDLGMNLDAEGKYWVRKGVALPEGEEIKFRFQHGWDVNFGGSFAVDAAIELAAGGSNMKTVEGTYDIYLDADGAKAYFMTEGKTPADAGEAEVVYIDPSAESFVVGFSGSAIQWNDPSFDENDRASFESKNVTDEATFAGTYEFKLAEFSVAENDEFKVRINGEWIGVSGATVEGLAVSGSDNFVAGETGTYSVVITFAWDGLIQSDVKVVFSK